MLDSWQTNPGRHAKVRFLFFLFTFHPLTSLRSPLFYISGHIVGIYSPGLSDPIQVFISLGETPSFLATFRGLTVFFARGQSLNSVSHYFHRGAAIG